MIFYDKNVKCPWSYSKSLLRCCANKQPCSIENCAVYFWVRAMITDVETIHFIERKINESFSRKNKTDFIKDK